MLSERERERVVIYGMGVFFQKNYKWLESNYEIVAFADQNKKGIYEKKEIYPIEMLNKYAQNIKVVIMIESIQACIDVAHILQYDQGFSADRIILGIGLEACGMLKDGIEEIAYTSEGDILVKIKGFSCTISSQDEFNNIKEVLVDEVYHYYINNSSKDIVFDVGMNVGDATHYFLQMNKVKKVYAYEPFKATYLKAISNLGRNDERLECFQYGLSYKTEKRVVSFNLNMSCGMSTLEDVTEQAIRNYEEWGLVKREDSVIECIEVRKASEVLGLIMERHKDDNLVLKMDCEGEEYGIFEDLEAAKLLDKFEFIMLEWHYRGKEPILKILRKAGFSYWTKDESSKTGLIYAYHQHRCC